MISIKALITNSLKGVGIPIIQEFIKESPSFPSMVIQEANNVPYQIVDNDEAISTITYKIFIYSKKEEELIEGMLRVNKIMMDMGFNRKSSKPGEVTGYLNTIMEFEAKINNKNGISYK